MPAAYIHENIAKEAIKLLKNVPQDILCNAYTYELGAQGPDALFYYNVLKFWDKDYSINELGETMHRIHIRKFFKAAMLYAKERGKAAPSWLMGFVTHYAADTTIHPFVYARTDNPDGSRNLIYHLSLEAAFDTWYHRHVLKKRGIPRQVSCVKKLTHVQKEDIAYALSHACNDIYPEVAFTSSNAYKLICDMNNVVGMLYSPLKIKHGIYVLIEKIIKKPQVVTCHEVPHTLPQDDFLNLDKEKWNNPWDKTIISTASFPELFEEAAKKAAEYITIVNEFFEGNITEDEAANLLGNNHYSSGLPVPES